MDKCEVGYVAIVGFIKTQLILNLSVIGET